MVMSRVKAKKGTIQCALDDWNAVSSSRDSGHPECGPTQEKVKLKPISDKPLVFRVSQVSSQPKAWSPLDTSSPDHFLYLFNAYDPVNAQLHDGRSALIVAICRRAPLALIVTLLDHGADPLISDLDGKDALCYAYEKGRYDVLVEFSEMIVSPMGKGASSSNTGKVKIDWEKEKKKNEQGKSEEQVKKVEKVMERANRADLPPAPAGGRTTIPVSRVCKPLLDALGLTNLQTLSADTVKQAVLCWVEDEKEKEEKEKKEKEKKEEEKKEEETEVKEQNPAPAEGPEVKENADLERASIVRGQSLLRCTIFIPGAGCAVFLWYFGMPTAICVLSFVGVTMLLAVTVSLLTTHYDCCGFFRARSHPPSSGSEHTPLESKIN